MTATMDLKIPYKIYPYAIFDCNRPLHFVVVGAGGTGGYLIRDLARLIGINNNKYSLDIGMTIVDGDQVESKNLERQNFIAADLGQNKAAVNAFRYSGAFGVDIGFIDEYIPQDVSQWKRLDELSQEKRIILIGCVDNNKTRKALHTLYRKGNFGSRNLRIAGYIDSGNEETAGQVVVSFKATDMAGAIEESDFNTHRSSYILPDIFERFDMATDDKHPDDLSCAERAESSPQNILTNITAANIILNFCAKLIHNNYLSTIVRSAHDTNLEYVKSIFSIASSIVYPIIYFDIETGLQSGEKVLSWYEDNEQQKEAILNKMVFDLGGDYVSSNTKGNLLRDINRDREYMIRSTKVQFEKGVILQP